MSERESVKSVSSVYANQTGRQVLILLFVEIFAFSTGLQVSRFANTLDKIAFNMNGQPGLGSLVSAMAGCVILWAVLKLKKGMFTGAALVLVNAFLRGLQVSAVYLSGITCRLWLIPVLIASEMLMFSAITATALAQDAPNMRKSAGVYRVNWQRLLLWFAVIALDGVVAPFITAMSI